MFDAAFFAFLRDLKAHNTREWFADNKARYVSDVETPALAFVDTLAPKLKVISPRFIARATRVGGSLFRIQRDTRFSPDKTPFKTYMAMRFRHDGKVLDQPPSFYLRLAPGECMGGGGIYHTDSAVLRKIRERIDAQPKQWRAVLASGLEIQGEQLKRVPAGFAKDHPLAEDLKRKDYFALRTFSAEEVAAPDFVDQYAHECRRTAPLVQFLCDAIELKF